LEHESSRIRSRVGFHRHAARHHAIDSAVDSF
jgi:hypothetical protein